MSKLLKPSCLELDSGAARALNMVALYAANGAFDKWPNLVGKGTITSANPASLKYTAGPGGMGAYSNAGVYETRFANTSANAFRGWGNFITMFGVISFPSVGSLRNFASAGALSSNYALKLTVDSTVGFRACYVDAGYVEQDIQSIGTVPAVNTPIAYVARFSGSSHGNVRSIHTSDGLSVAGTAGLTTYDPIALVDVNSAVGGSGEHSNWVGHSYQMGVANRLWSLEEVANYLEDPWFFLRRRSLVSKYTAALGPSTAPEIAVSGNGVNIADGDATPSTADHTDFGSTIQGNGTITRTFTVQNTGDAALTTSGLTVPTGFTVVEGLSASIAPAGSDTFQVRLDDAVVGVKSGNISFTTNDGDENPFNFAITGEVTAAAPEVAVTGAGNNIADGDATPSVTDNTDYGTVAQGNSPVQRTYRVTNNGTASLTTSGLTVPAGFSVVEGLSGSIAAGNYDEFIVQLDTAVVGVKSGQISFTTNDGDENPFNFSITGEVTEPPPAGSLSRPITAMSLSRGLVKTADDWTF